MARTCYIVTGSALIPVRNRTTVASGPGDPATVEIDSGDEQTATAGEAFAAALVVIVKDASGVAVPNVTVDWSAGTDPLTLDEASTTTDAEGKATVTVTSTGTAGTGLAVSATVSGLTPATFTLAVTASAPATVTVYSGTPQSALVNVAFSAPMVALVKDAYDNVVPSTTVAFAAPGTEPTAVLSAATADTDANGRATITATAGVGGGAYNVTATVGALDPATFALTNISLLWSIDERLDAPWFADAVIPGLGMDAAATRAALIAQGWPDPSGVGVTDKACWTFDGATAPYDDKLNSYAMADGGGYLAPLLVNRMITGPKIGGSVSGGVGIEVPYGSRARAQALATLLNVGAGVSFLWSVAFKARNRFPGGYATLASKSAWADNHGWRIQLGNAQLDFYTYDGDTAESHVTYALGGGFYDGATHVLTVSRDGGGGSGNTIVKLDLFTAVSHASQHLGDLANTGRYILGNLDSIYNDWGPGVQYLWNLMLVGVADETFIGHDAFFASLWPWNPAYASHLSPLVGVSYFVGAHASASCPNNACPHASNGTQSGLVSTGNRYFLPAYNDLVSGGYWTASSCSAAACDSSDGINDAAQLTMTGDFPTANLHSSSADFSSLATPSNCPFYVFVFAKSSAGAHLHIDVNFTGGAGAAERLTAIDGVSIGTDWTLYTGIVRPDAADHDHCDYYMGALTGEVVKIAFWGVIINCDTMPAGFQITNASIHNAQHMRCRIDNSSFDKYNPERGHFVWEIYGHGGGIRPHHDSSMVMVLDAADGNDGEIDLAFPEGASQHRFLGCYADFTVDGQAFDLIFPDPGPGYHVVEAWWDSQHPVHGAYAGVIVDGVNVAMAKADAGWSAALASSMGDVYQWGDEPDADGVCNSVCMSQELYDAPITARIPAPPSSSEWLLVRPDVSFPAPRVGAALVWEQAHGYLLAIHRSTGSDTWKLVDRTWTELHPATAMATLTVAGCCYDVTDGYALVLDSAAGTFKWDHATQNFVALSPAHAPTVPASSGYRLGDMCYFATGGYPIYVETTGKIWKWVDGDWVDTGQTATGSLAGVCIADDPDHGYVLIQCGWDYWTFDGATCARIYPNRAHADVVAAAANAFPGPYTEPPEGRAIVAHADAGWDGGNLQIVGVTSMGYACTETVALAAGVTSGSVNLWSTITSLAKTAVGTTGSVHVYCPPLFALGSAMAYAENSSHVERYGGKTGATAVEPYQAARANPYHYYWDGSGWTLRNPSLLAVPLSRYWHAMAYDGDHNRTVIFAGRLDEHSATAELWEFIVN